MSPLQPPEGLSEAILEAARNAGIGVAVTARGVDEQVRNLWVNDVVVRMLGRPYEEILKASVFAFIAPDEVQRMSDMSAARSRGEDQPWAFETAFIHADGSRIAAYVALSPLGFQELPASITFIADITRRHEVEAALRESEARFRRVIESAPDAIMITRDGTLLYVNPAGARLLAFDSPADLIGRHFASFVEEDDASVMSDRTRAILQRGERFAPREYRVRARDGRRLTFEVTSHLVEYEGAPAVLGFGRDITERSRMQEHLARADRLAALGTLAAGVAHEINNPLAFVTLGIDSLEAHLHRAIPDPVLRAELVARLEPIRTGASRVAEIVRDLKAFSRSDDEPARDIDVGAVIRAAERLAAHELKHRAQVRVSIDGSPRAHGQPGRLEQVMVNLLVNAAQAFPPNRSDGHVHVRCAVNGERIEIEIEDDGIGIPDEILGRVFDPFFTTKPAGVGTGLGLPICQSIVTAMGGTIALESAVGRGTTVRIVLPAVRGRLDATAPPKSKPPAGRRLKVLVVDDEPALARMLDTLLSRDHDVELAPNGVEALERIARERFDVVLCDVMMPRMGGRELHGRVAASDPALASRFVFMTGGAIDPETDRWLEAAETPRLWKPFSTDALLDALRRASESGAERG